MAAVARVLNPAEGNAATLAPRRSGQFVQVWTSDERGGTYLQYARPLTAEQGAPVQHSQQRGARLKGSTRPLTPPPNTRRKVTRARAPQGAAPLRGRGPRQRELALAHTFWASTCQPIAGCRMLQCRLSGVWFRWRTGAQHAGVQSSREHAPLTASQQAWGRRPSQQQHPHANTMHPGNCYNGIQKWLARHSLRQHHKTLHAHTPSGPQQPTP